MLDSAWLVPLCPLAGAVLNGFFGRRYRPETVGQIAIAAVGLSFLLSLAITIALTTRPEPLHQVTYFTWIASGAYSASVGLLLDGLSCTMMLVVSGVGLLVHVYSTGYMHDDEDQGRYFTYLNLFVGAMLILVMADNYLLMFVGWEGVGLCSYLLIGFWYTRRSASDAGKKAFVVNRVGDVGFVLAVLLLFVTFQSVDFLDVQHQLEGMKSSQGEGHGSASPAVLTAIALLLFMGAVGKSAQVPLHVWLPDAMEGPTPVSALIHAATMVTAGVYMMARSALLYDLAPVALDVVAVVGVLTALFAASMALVAADIKRVLAYSTVSQLGFMVFALGVGAWAAAIFHLVTHAFFKALLFLGAGSVIHALGGEQDMRRMGGLRQALPTTHWTMATATLAIAGIFPLAGFWSKDEILASAMKAGGAGVLGWLAASVAAFMTAFYMFRLLYMTFYGESRVEPEAAAHLHEAPDSMRAPLMLLALLSALGGVVLGFPPEHGMLHRWLEPVFEAAAHPHAFSFVDIILMVISLAVAAAGWHLAYRFYVREPHLPEQWQARWQGTYDLLVNTWYVDELYTRVVVGPIYRLSNNGLWRAFDLGLIDRIVNGVGRVVRLDGEFLSSLQTGYARTYALTLVVGAIIVFWGLSG